MDPIVSCPYDAVHRICKSKVPYHITRCKSNNDSSMNDSKVCCPFDASHIIDKDYSEDHVEGCPTAGNVKNFLYNLEPQKRWGTVPLEEVVKLKVPIMKDWDEEDVETYDPWKSTLTRNIIRFKPGGSKAQKRKFKLAERRRIKALEKEDKLKLHQTVFCKHNPLKEYVSMPQLVKNLNRMSLNKFNTSLENIDISNLRISKTNKFHEYKYLSQLAEGMLAKKLEELVLHCMKKKVL